MLSETPGRLKRLSAGLPEGRLQAPLGPGERSFVATLAHLLNVEARTAEAIFAALLVDEPALLPIHAERDWGALARYERLPFPDLLAYFNVRRVMLLGVLKGLDEREWGRTVQEAGKKRRESVYWKARGQALHELEHLEDLEIKLRG